MRSIDPFGAIQFVFAIGRPISEKELPSSGTVKVSVAKHPPGSVTVTLKLPALRFWRSSVRDPLDQMKLLAAEGVMVRSILPLPAPHTDGLTMDEMVITGVLSATTNVPVDEQEVASVIVTVNAPTSRFARSSVVAPFDQRKVYVPAGVTDRSIEPLGFVQEVLATGIAEKEKLVFRFVTSNVSSAWQPLASVTMTL